MKTQIDINCPDFYSNSLKTNCLKSYGKQNYQCKDCRHQFIDDHATTYQICYFKIEYKIGLITARSYGVRYVAAITSVNIGKVLGTSKDELLERRVASVKRSKITLRRLIWCPFISITAFSNSIILFETSPYF